MKTALITGITGQDGSYLAELLLEKGYQVHGMVRRSSTFNTGRIDHIRDDLTLHYGDLGDATSIENIINKVEPDEIYNLAAQSHVKISFDVPEYTGDIDGLAVVRFLEIIRRFKTKKIRFYQASTSELFGKVVEIPQTETTPFYPRSPYGVAKLYAYWIVKNYREAYDIYAVNGILFNHESPRRGENFVTKKVTKSLVEIHRGKRDCLYLGNIDAQRDWGYAKDYVECMWMMLQQESPDDFVIASGETHTVRELIEIACRYLQIELEWQGEGINEIGIDKRTQKEIIRIDPKFYRPTEVDLLLGDASKAKSQLDWSPKVTFEELVKLMIDYDSALSLDYQGI